MLMKRDVFKKRAPFYFDVDDTILTDNGEGPPYPNAKEVIEGLIKIGNEVNIWSARGKDWAKHVTENILQIKGCNAYLTKPRPSKTFDDKPYRISQRLVGVKTLLSGDDWYKLGMKYLRWKKIPKLEVTCKAGLKLSKTETDENGIMTVDISPDKKTKKNKGK